MVLIGFPNGIHRFPVGDDDRNSSNYFATGSDFLAPKWEMVEAHFSYCNCELSTPDIYVDLPFLIVDR